MSEIIEPKDIDVVVNPSEVNTCVQNDKNIAVTVNRKEYNIVGDELYIPKRYEDAPPWMQNIITSLVKNSTDTTIDGINKTVDDLNSLIQALDVAKNTYTQSIISSNDIDTRINNAITTLNSSLSNADSNILNIAQTATTPDEAKTLITNALTASINSPDSGSIGSVVNEIKQAVANGDKANANTSDILESTIKGLDGEVESNAKAVNLLKTEVDKTSALAGEVTALNTYLKDPDTGIIGGAQSRLTQDVISKASSVESKFAYNSNLNIGGVYYTSGFGLKAIHTKGSGTQADPYDSEFWINAEKFKFTNSAMTGNVVPFSIDASGSTPQVTFDGIVDFTNTNIKNGSPGTTKINAGSIETNAITAINISADAISGKNITGGTIIGSEINGVTITGSVIKGSYIDMTTTSYLTNWQLYTPSTIPSAYRNNFAKNNDGSLIVDSSGYVRLIGVLGLTTGAVIKDGLTAYHPSSSANYHYSFNMPETTIGLYSYDSYTVNTNQRMIKNSHVISPQGTPGTGDITLYRLNLSNAGYNMTDGGSINGSIQLFGDTISFSGYVKNLGSSTGSGSANVTVKRNGITVFNKTVNGYGNERFSKDYTIRGLTYTVTASVVGSYGYELNTSVTIKDSNFTVTGMTRDDRIKIGLTNCSVPRVSVNPRSTYTSCIVNIPSLRVI